MTAPFRQTLWFKRGELPEPAGEEAPVPLPIEDRYADDGTMLPGDSYQYGLHCGQTCQLPVDLETATEVVSLDDSELQALARELRGSRVRIAALCASASAVAAVLIGVL